MYMKFTFFCLIMFIFGDLVPAIVSMEHRKTPFWCFSGLNDLSENRPEGKEECVSEIWAFVRRRLFGVEYRSLQRHFCDEQITN